MQAASGSGACGALLSGSLSSEPWSQLSSRSKTLLGFSITILAVVEVRFSLSVQVRTYSVASECQDAGRSNLAIGAGVSGEPARLPACLGVCACC